MATPGGPEIARRLRGLARRRTSSGLLSVEESAALSSVGFEQVSEVMGAVAYAVTPGGYYPAGLRTKQYGLSSVPWTVGPTGRGPRTYISSRPTAAVGVPPKITAFKAGYRTSLGRLVEEAKAVGADGVVGVRVTRSRIRSGGLPVWSFVAIGTAIRSIGRSRAAAPFTTALPPAQVASALRAGWVPISYLACPVLALRWVDQSSSLQMGMTARNGEISAHTKVVNDCRHQARTDFADAARLVHADAAVMSAMSIDLAVRGPAEVTVVITGTALARFGRPRALEPLTIMALSGPAR
jgi:uncharacterized protein YbjQ (UPF0145 family)